MKVSRITIAGKYFQRDHEKFFVKGVSYGPFKPREDGHHLPEASQINSDLELITTAGINTLRIYHLPPESFVQSCAARGIYLIVSLPWEQHVDFLGDETIKQRVEQSILQNVEFLSEFPNILACMVGNEIPATLVRWMGNDKLTQFLDSIIVRAKQIAPELLFSYASYPTTEYLVPRNADFLTYNIYLHKETAFDRYLLRLQNIAGDKPLLIGEFGIDTAAEGEETQKVVLDWHIRKVTSNGLAGTCLFAWTDEWFTGGKEITEWQFGLVTQDRTPKPAYSVVSDYFSKPRITNAVSLQRYPLVSVIVCCYDAGATLHECLDAIQAMHYPAFEVIVVNDGSTDNTPVILNDFPNITVVNQENLGLSAARNNGAAAANGEILAYTDADCMPDPDWLYYLVSVFEKGDFAAVGGPNLPPPATDAHQACVIAAPGGPSHVLLDDLKAEHIPGCNMAIQRWAFDKVGGFDPRFRIAGDDVDLCWRLQRQGEVIGFSPGAMVWHYRRFTPRAFLSQQWHYGEAESLLRYKHLARFDAVGNAKWSGAVYGNQRSSGRSLFGPLIYQGVFGSAMFQSLYTSPRTRLLDYSKSFEWLVVTALLVVLAIAFPSLAWIPITMLAATIAIGINDGLDAALPPEYDTPLNRTRVCTLTILQPWYRGLSRWLSWLKVKHTPTKTIRSQTVYPETDKDRLAYWSESGVYREVLLEAIFAKLADKGWRFTSDTGWMSWDVQAHGSLWWNTLISTVTEYHGDEKMLTRVKTRLRLSRLPFLVTLTGILLLAIVLHSAAIFFILALILGMWLFIRAVRLRRAIHGLIHEAATKFELERIP